MARECGGSVGGSWPCIEENVGWKSGGDGKMVRSTEMVSTSQTMPKRKKKSDETSSEESAWEASGNEDDDI